MSSINVPGNRDREVDVIVVGFGAAVRSDLGPPWVFNIEGDGSKDSLQ